MSGLISGSKGRLGSRGALVVLWKWAASISDPGMTGCSQSTALLSCIERLKRGENVEGGLGKPLVVLNPNASATAFTCMAWRMSAASWEDCERIMREAGLTAGGNP